MLRMAKRRAIQSGEVVEGDSQNDLYCDYALAVVLGKYGTIELKIYLR